MTSGWIASSRRPSETLRLASCARTAAIVLGEDVHLAVGVVVAEAVERDVDVDRGDVEALDRRVGRARLAGAGERAGLLGALHGEHEGRRGDGEDERRSGRRGRRRPTTRRRGAPPHGARERAAP